MKHGVFIGRFQPFHNGHLQNVLNALKQVDTLSIGIGSSQEHHTIENPFTVMERMEMISLTLKDLFIENYILFSVPDFHDDASWIQYVANATAPFEIAFTGKNEWTERCFAGKGYEVARLPWMEGISGTLIREKIRLNQEWKQLVPETVVSYLYYIKGIERIKEHAQP